MSTASAIPIDVFWRSKEVGEHIARVAAAIEKQEEFSRRAQESAQLLGRRAVRKSSAYFWAPPAKPPDLEGRFEGLGEWMAVCQAAIFELWFHLGSVALKDLRRVAFGFYDWTQANATEVLCRLALAGLETERTAAEIAKALPKWRYEQVMRVCERVAELAARCPVLQQAYDQLTDAYRENDAVDGLALVAAAARFNPARVHARYGDFLRGLMDGHGLEGRTAYDDGQVVATADGRGLLVKGGPSYPQIIVKASRLAFLSPGFFESRLLNSSLGSQRFASPEPTPGLRAGFSFFLDSRFLLILSRM